MDLDLWKYDIPTSKDTRANTLEIRTATSLWHTITVNVEWVPMEWTIRNISRIDDENSKLWVEFKLPENCKNKAA